MSDRQLEDAARWMPVVILVYFALQFVIRVSLSANLETDEAQFVGKTYLALGYGNSHPPLYNWLVAGALALTNGHWSTAMALLKNVLLAGTYLLAFDTCRRVTGRSLTGAIVVASFLLLPQIVWKSQITLAHSVLVMFAVVATLHAVVCILERGNLASFLWLGLAAVIGALAKYNYLLTLIAVLIAAASIAEIRRALFVPKLAASVAAFALLFAPHAVWALQNLASTTERMAKLERDSGALGALDLPYIGIDGFLDYLVAGVAWAGPLLLAWFLIRYFSRREDGAALPAEEARRRSFALLFGRTTLIGAAAFALIILAGDLHSVSERYLTPLLVPLPFWMALAWPLEGRTRAPVTFLRVGAVVALLMVTAWPAKIIFGRDQYAYPYAAMTASLRDSVAGPFTVLGSQEKYAANVAVRLDRADVWEEGSGANQVVVVWDARRRQSPDELVARLGNGFEPRGAVMAMTYPYDNLSGAQAQLNAQLYARNP
jgi:4-amino-4-deoxy-L-arabinose transferase-like glycosyltransferase